MWYALQTVSFSIIIIIVDIVAGYFGVIAILRCANDGQAVSSLGLLYINLKMKFTK